METDATAPESYRTQSPTGIEGAPVNHKITIIGIGDDGLEGLTRQALDQIASAGTIFGAANLLRKVEQSSAYKSTQRLEPTIADLDRMAETIDSESSYQWCC